MTPNPPSGAPRSWKSKFQAWLTRLTGAGLPPVSAPSPTPLAPVAPAISQEQFTDAQRPITQQQEVRTRQLMDRICAVNNANVTRNYGTHTEDLTKHHQPAPLTVDDMADFDRLLTTARPLDPPGARESVFAEPRRTPEEYALHARMVADRAGITTARRGVPTPTPVQVAGRAGVATAPLGEPPKLRRFDVANYLRTEEEREEYLRQAAADGVLEEAQLDVERSRRVPHPVFFVPDLPSAAAVQAQIASVTGYEPPAPAPSYDSGGGGDFGGGGASSSWD